MTEDLLTEHDGTVDPTKNYLEELVGEGKKFKTAEDMARGKYESDQYIKIMERRQDEMRADNLRLREESTTRARLEELIDQLKTQQLASSDHTQAKEDMKPTITPDQIDSLVSSKIQEHETTKRQTENFNLVRDKLQQRYGPNYKDTVKRQIDDLGLTEAELNDMAKRQPKVLIKTLGLDQEPPRDSFQTPPRSQQRSDNFAPAGAPKRTWKYYQDLKKSNPQLYFDRKTAIQMQQDAIDLGESFRDGDYFVKGLHENN